MALVVDDEESYLKTFRDALAEAGCRVACCAAPPKAREVALEVEPDILLLDLVMPELDGVELCRHFRADPRFKTAVIVLMTSEADLAKKPDAIVQALEAGADDYLIKPSGIQEVPIRLRAWWRAKRLRDELITNAQQTLQDLANSEERYRHLFERAPFGIGVATLDGQILAANRQMELITGFSAEELKAVNLADTYVNPDDRARLLETVRTSAGVTDYPARLKRKDGTEYHASLTIGVVNIGGKAVLQTLVQDITEHKRAEEALRQSEERFRILFEHAADSILLLEIMPEGTPVIRDANSATFRLLGFERDELIGQPVSFLDAEPDAAKVVEQRRRNILSGTGRTFEARHRRKDGTIRHVECSVTEMQIGSKTFAISVERDITGRKRKEEEIRSLAKFPSENPNPVLRVDRKGSVLYANASSQRLLAKWLGPADFALPASLKELVGKALGTRVCKQMDMDVGGRTFALVLAPVPEAGYVNIYGLDITERKQLAEVLRHEQAYNAAVLSSMADALFVVSSQGAIVSCNQRALDMLGYGRDELIGCSLGKISAPSPGLPGGGLKGVGKGLLHGKIRDADAFLRHRDGSAVPVSLSCSLLSMPSVEPSELVLVARDVSARQRLQEEQRNYMQRLEREVGKRTEDIRKSAEEYRTLFKNVDHAIITTDLDNKVLTCNPAAERLFGWKEAEILSRTPGAALCGKPHHAKYADIPAKVAKLGFWSHEGTGRRADGQDFPMHLSVSVIRQESGLPRGMIWIITDLSDRFGLEETAQRARDYAEIVLAQFGPHGVLVGNGPAHKRIVRFVSDAAGVPSPVLVLGESGTGKEVVARAIHANSPRANKPFVVVDCSALQGSLLESELFGHEKGAFTGASETKMGLVELAAGGTLFVDEIGNMRLDLQAKLLRILDCGEFRRVGSLKERKVDMRIIAATNRDLAKEVSSGRFRNDLYFRLNVLSITMPPLRERREDIPLLAKHFVKHNRVTMAGKKRFRADALQCLQAYDWPGNIRELANVVERAVILAGPHSVLEPSHLPPETRATAAHPERGPQARSLAQAEKEAVEAALAATNGNRSKAAKMLGTSRMTLRKMMNTHGIPVLKH